jgi:hypothetical protein
MHSCTEYTFGNTVLYEREMLPYLDTKTKTIYCTARSRGVGFRIRKLNIFVNISLIGGSVFLVPEINLTRIAQRFYRRNEIKILVFGK